MDKEYDTNLLTNTASQEGHNAFALHTNDPSSTRKRVYGQINQPITVRLCLRVIQPPNHLSSSLTATPPRLRVNQSPNHIFSSFSHSTPTAVETLGGLIGSTIPLLTKIEKTHLVGILINGAKMLPLQNNARIILSAVTNFICNSGRFAQNLNQYFSVLPENTFFFRFHALSKPDIYFSRGEHSHTF